MEGVGKGPLSFYTTILVVLVLDYLKLEIFPFQNDTFTHDEYM